MAGRTAAASSRVQAQVLGSIQKSPPIAAASQKTSSTHSLKPRARVSPPSESPRSTNSYQASRNLLADSDVSPSVVTQMPIASPQAAQPASNVQQAAFRLFPQDHSVAAVHTQEVDNLNETSTLSSTETGNAKAMRMLPQYFVSLAASGTVRGITEEKDLITDKLGLTFKKVKLINADIELSYEGNIAKVLYKEMKIPETYKAIWWDQMKSHV